MKRQIHDRQCLLIAMPQLADPNFYRSVSILTEYDEKAAMGLILNRPTQNTLAQAIASDAAGLDKIPVFLGGPVQVDNGCYIHAYPEISTEGLPIDGGLYMHGSMEVMHEIIQRHGQDEVFYFRFLVGYAGWGAGQLESEIAVSSWLTQPIDREFIFGTPPEKLWTHSIQRLGINPDALVAPNSSGTAH